MPFLRAPIDTTVSHRKPSPSYLERVPFSVQLVFLGKGLRLLPVSLLCGSGITLWKKCDSRGKTAPLHVFGGTVLDVRQSAANSKQECVNFGALIDRLRETTGKRAMMVDIFFMEADYALDLKGDKSSQLSSSTSAEYNFARETPSQALARFASAERFTRHFGLVPEWDDWFESGTKLTFPGSTTSFQSIEKLKTILDLAGWRPGPLVRKP
ncbi:hypothetical protein JR316_0012311 [Psilocybe cubensis]|uniref:Uncharacterized protein n=1 Tax=Psilocybe cubensis TaxID=181762 RepID=A0ACB8GIB9_PSICU|nr:hypothetical protein JR316_0012311 [Psilocybe cubensis]KAH9475200.1 hypothetical protein JR316_0012311 [Psilocybe cubensis]